MLKGFATQRAVDTRTTKHKKRNSKNLEKMGFTHPTRRNKSPTTKKKGLYPAALNLTTCIIYNMCQTYENKNKKIEQKRKTRKVKGGMKLLTSGTHGHIYEKGDQVVKQFLNKDYHHPSLCKRVKGSIESMCDAVDYEFQVHQMIQQLFDSFLVKVPKASSFRLTEVDKKPMCEYEMDRIYPLDDYLLYVDMTFPEGTREAQNSISRTLGYTNIAELLQMSPEELARVVGEMFSLLHFKLNVDGYDCELLVGKHGEDTGLYFIDFDKVSCFTYELGQTLIRKTSESDYEPRTISSYTRLARFLFGAMISMSLLPTDPELKDSFLMGYTKHVDASVPDELIDELKSIIIAYPD